MSRDKAERVYRFHQNTLDAVRELTQVAGLRHPGEFRTTHLVRRVSHSDVRLLANLLPSVRAGELLEAAAGRADWPHAVYRLYWDCATPHSFAAGESEQRQSALVAVGAARRA